MLAKRGRASYTGERSKDSVDAGAMAVAVIAEHINQAWLDRHARPTGTQTDRTRRSVMKKFVNDPKQFVPEMLEGIALANPDTLTYVPEYNLIMRSDAPKADKVSIVQGSGSGHEPAHVMVVGKGMLDAACPGDVFAAPPMDYVLRDHQAPGLRQGRAAAGEQLHRRPDGLRHGQGDGRVRGHPDRDPLHQRRCRRQGLHLHDRPARRRRELLRDQGGRRGRRGGRRPGGVRADRREGQRRHPHHGRRAHRVHPAGQGLPAVRARRRRDRDGRRHPRRARPRAQGRS